MIGGGFNVGIHSVLNPFQVDIGFSVQDLEIVRTGSWGGVFGSFLCHLVLQEHQHLVASSDYQEVKMHLPAKIGDYTVPGKNAWKQRLCHEYSRVLIPHLFIASVRDCFGLGSLEVSLGFHYLRISILQESMPRMWVAWCVGSKQVSWWRSIELLVRCFCYPTLRWFQTCLFENPEPWGFIRSNLTFAYFSDGLVFPTTN